ncbi:DUF664 domain-containing protein [Micromonospora sp. BRA006-A]|nr:DUF664 domain-containing protein [Micromonospora sp. BRA006-A]
MDDATTETEAEALLAVLERNRRTFAWKTDGLDETGLRAVTAASTMTLGGLIAHMALVETDWLAVKVAGQGYGPPWEGIDFDAEPDWGGVSARRPRRTTCTRCGAPRCSGRAG